MELALLSVRRYLVFRPLKDRMECMFCLVRKSVDCVNKTVSIGGRQVKAHLHNIRSLILKLAWPNLPTFHMPKQQLSR